MHGLEISFKKNNSLDKRLGFYKTRFLDGGCFYTISTKTRYFIKYCSYRDPEGSIIGDPVYREYTRHQTQRLAGRTSELERNTS